MIKNVSNRRKVMNYIEAGRSLALAKNRVRFRNIDTLKVVKISGDFVILEYENGDRHTLCVGESLTINLDLAISEPE